MSRGVVVGLTLAAGLALCGCGRPQKSSRGFHLPDCDPLRGQMTFVELRCHSCHEVRGVPLPRPVGDPPVGVVLGGPYPRVRTDGQLVTAILDPSRSIAWSNMSEVHSGNLSRMGDFTETMTVRQLIDIAAFLQAHTEVQPPRFR